MTLNEIKSAVDQGKTIHWQNQGYMVTKGHQSYFISCRASGHCIGLTWTDGRTLNGDPADFYLAPDDLQVDRAYDALELYRLAWPDENTDLGVVASSLIKNVLHVIRQAGGDAANILAVHGLALDEFKSEVCAELRDVPLQCAGGPKARDWAERCRHCDELAERVGDLRYGFCSGCLQTQRARDQPISVGVRQGRRHDELGTQPAT